METLYSILKSFQLLHLPRKALVSHLNETRKFFIWYDKREMERGFSLHVPCHMITSHDHPGDTNALHSNIQPLILLLYRW